MNRLVAIVLVALWAWPVAAKTPPTAIVAEVIDGDTVLLDQPVHGAQEVRLVGIQAPKLPLGRPGFRAWPLADAAKRALSRMLLEQPVTLRFGSLRIDRHGRLLAHLTDADGRWMQGEMLRDGWARVYTFVDNRERAAEMLALEDDARRSGRGIWSHPFYAVRGARDVETLTRDIGSFQVVDGRVVAVARVRSTVYLNFDQDWRTDFTVRLDAAARRVFETTGVDPLALEGRRIRVRGWLRSRNGPMIDATHPEQIEVLDLTPGHSP